MTFVRITFKVHNKQANIDAPEEKCFRPRVAFWKSVKSPRFCILLAASILFKINPNLIQRNLK